MADDPGGPRDALEHHTRLSGPLSECPLVAGNRVTLLDDAQSAICAIFDAVEAARDHVHMEYYTSEDVVLGGRSLFSLLEAKARAGIEVALIWDAIGSAETPDAQFARLRGAGVRLLEYHSVNPLRRTFNFSLNDRDHRKLTVVDGAIGFLGGVNMSKVYETPASAGQGPEPNAAFWIDNAVRIEGPAVAEIQLLFFTTWRGQGNGRAGRGAGDDLPMRGGPEDAPTPWPRQGPATGTATGTETLRIDGSAPRQRRPLYNISIRAAIEGARRHIVLASGYFVPTPREWRLLAAAARRGVAVDLLLPGYSDVPAAIHAARAIYGGLLRAGVRIHEVHRGVLHAKVATIDGAWTAIGSSNFDRRSVYYNNEIDAIVLGHATAASVEAMLRQEIAKARPVSLRAWESRSWRERAAELSTRLWKQLI